MNQKVKEELGKIGFRVESGNIDGNPVTFILTEKALTEKSVKELREILNRYDIE